jgi:hypothetical protein
MHYSRIRRYRGRKTVPVFIAYFSGAGPFFSLIHTAPEVDARIPSLGNKPRHTDLVSLRGNGGILAIPGHGNKGRVVRKTENGQRHDQKTDLNKGLKSHY